MTTPADVGSMSAPGSMTICKVWDSEYPWDVRAEKISASLTAAGHRVRLIARNRRGAPLRERMAEAEVFRLAPLAWAPRRVSDVSMFPAFFNPRWYRAILRVASMPGTDLILCRDLPLVPTCVWAGHRLGLPVVLDMAENYPAMLRSRWATGRMKWHDAFVRSPLLARAVERWSLSRVDGVLVVVEESATRLISLGVDPARVTVVSNTPPLSRLDDPPSEHRAGTSLRLVYLGLLEEQRGVGTLLDAVGMLRHAGLPVTLSIFGGGLDEALLRAKARSLGLLEPDVVFHGWVPNSEALAALRHANIGVIPHWRDESWNTTVPNKLFDYMTAGLAVVTSDAIPAARIVRSTGCGAVFQDRDAASLAAAVQALEPAAVRQEAAMRGRTAVRATYNWEADAARLFASLRQILNSRTGPLRG